MKANDGGDWESVNCFAHTLQLAINEAFKAATSLERIAGACSELVTHFHHSTIATNALLAKQLTLPKHKVIHCCKPRWNPLYHMFARLAEQRWAVCAVLLGRAVTKHSNARNLELRDDYWRLLAEITPVLKSLATAATCGQTAVSCPVMRGLTSGGDGAYRKEGGVSGARCRR
ncbi:hypothetical protein AAFF_G00402240 [Aldrovandia affinis]|uniref:Uncharacterized protein n=1 Tax=Aldrovandia affinis TaxID=143900 RepID=A0AAD7T7B8_9TELE|nr:hypothetical protein AAFF_G00402240 [Aldrovandia affinis]